jgi:hypothetical protein
MENMSIAEKSNHAIMDSGMNEEILNLEKKLSECLAEKDLATREKNEMLIMKTRLTQEIEEIEEEIKVKAEAILPELKKEQEALTEVIEATEKNITQLQKGLDEIRSKRESEHRGLVEQFHRVRVEFQELAFGKHKRKELLPVKRREQIERSTQCHKEIVRCDLISVIVDVTSHICETIFTSKQSKLKDM